MNREVFSFCFGDPLVWTYKGMEQFYPCAYKKLFFYNATFRLPMDVKGFDDFFNEAMEKLDSAIRSKRYPLETYTDALKMLNKILKRLLLTEYAKKKGLQKKKRRYYNYCVLCEAERVLTSATSTGNLVMEFFKRIDRELHEKPQLLTHQEHRFYHLYKTFLLTPGSSTGDREAIMQALDITPENFAKLKSNVKRKIVELIKYLAQTL